MTGDMKIRCNNCFEEYDEGLELCPFCGYEAGDPPADAFCLFPGTLIADRYIVGGKVSSGGFGIVYKAWDKKLENIVAIKEYYPSGLVNRLPGESDVILVATKREREFIYGKKRFLEEARNMAKFSSHKNIVNVYQFFEENNTAYIVMEYLSGKTLSEHLQQQNAPLPYDYCVTIAAEVCAALRAIHKENILHRDVSPDNIMLCNDGTVKLFDFGAARFSAGVENRVTVVVKPGFAPPEQYDKVNRQDPRTDIYALGATLYYAMTGVKPEESTNRKIEDTLVEPADIDTSIPQNISTAIMRAMAVEQQYRFADVDEFEKALLSERKVISVKKERARRKRRRAIGILLSLLVVIGAAGIFAHMYNSEKSDVELPDADLELWYIRTDVDEIDQAREAALNSIVQTFTGEYGNISVQLNSAEYDDYSDAIAKAIDAGNAAIIFESTEIDVPPAGLTELTEFLDDLQGISYYSSEYGSAVKYPTGIIAPTIYVNTAAGVTLEDISDLDDLIELCRAEQQHFVVKAPDIDMYAALYGAEIANYVSETAFEEFVSRDAFVYFGDSSDYHGVQDALPGEYSLMMPTTGKTTYRYGVTWSVFARNEDAEKAATALVSYFNSDLSQDFFHIQNQSGCLPIIKASMSKFVEVYDELSPVKAFLALPFTVPDADAPAMIDGADASKLNESKNVTSFAPEFEDVSEDAWYAEAVAEVCTRGLLEGTADTTFSPDAPISKLEVVLSLYRLAGSPAISEAAPFTDVDPEGEQGKAVAWAFENEIVSDSGDGTFGGNDPVNLETAMVLFLRFAEYYGLDLSTEVDLSARHGLFLNEVRLCAV